MRSKRMLRAIVLLILLISILPVGVAGAVTAHEFPPADTFQLPWDYGVAWMAIDGIDNGFKRPTSSSHNYSVGGAIDFAPHKYTVKGEDTSNFWVAAIGSGTVIGVSTCHVIIDHRNGWVSQYQFLGNVQVKLGDAVNRNQRLGIIADGVRYKYCVGSIDPDIPHLHFMLRPTLIGATFAGWQVSYNSLFNSTKFTKDGETLGLYKLLLNTFDSSSTPTPTPSTTPPSPTAITPTPTDPYVSTDVEDPDIDIGETTQVTVNLNNIPAGGYTSAEFTCTYDPVMLEVSNIIVTDLFGADPAVAINGPQNGTLIVAIAGTHGNKATISGPAFSFNIKGLQAGQTNIECKVRVSMGDGQLMDLPSIGTVLTIHGTAPSPTLTTTPEPFPFPSFTPTPTLPAGDWLTFINLTYGFQFNYPPQAQIVSGGDDNFTRIDLPFTQGTNLREKYLEVIVVENANPCQSPLATQSMLQTSEMVTINGISFLKQTGEDGGAGHLHQWVAYSAINGSACVSLDFILHSLNPGNFPVPPPVFDYVAESAVFDQIVSTYTWLTQIPTSTPTIQPTATHVPDSILMGVVIANKPVTVRLYNLDNSLEASVDANPDGTFSLITPSPGTYTVVALASGFLSAQGTVILDAESTTTISTITLLAGDIDANNIIDQFDALTIGMNYNTAQPSVADLNNDGIINVLDLEALAGNYRKIGPIVWQ